MSEETESNPVADAIATYNADQESFNEEVADWKSQDASAEESQPSPDLLDAIQDTRPTLTEEEALEFERLRTHHVGADALAEEEAATIKDALSTRDEAPTVPECLSDCDPDAVLALLEKYSLAPEEVNDKWEMALRTELEHELVAEAESRAAIEEQLTLSPQEQMTQHIAQLEQLAQVEHQPEVLDLFSRAIAHVLESPSSIADKSRELATLAAQGMSNYAWTTGQRAIEGYLAQNFPAIIEHFLPGLAQLHQDALAQDVWENARAESEFTHLLPRYDTDEYHALGERLEKEHGWLAALDFTDAQGRPLPMKQAMQEKAALVIKLASGEQLTQATAAESIKKAVERGRQQERAVTRKVSAGKSLGAGRTRGEFTSKARDDFRQSIEDYMKNQRHDGI